MDNNKQYRHTKPVKQMDYLYFVEYEDYAPVMCADQDFMSFMGCSSIRNGNFYGRNLDLYYGNTPEFVVHIKGSDKRYESISVCANPLITNNVEQMSEKEISELPNIANDGINENGVLISENVVLPYGVDDKRGTNPGKEKIYAPYVTRYILDYAKSADHAIELLNDLNIVGGFKQYSLHWMIADENNTYIAEIINNKLVVSKNRYMYMTNFYLNLSDVESTQTIAGRTFDNIPCLNRSPIGVERWCQIRDNYESTNSVNGMMNLLKEVKATSAYYNNFYTEFTNKKLTIDSSLEEFQEEYKLQCEMYKNRDRDNPNGCWISWHSSVYDIENRELYICVQEDYKHQLTYKLK